MIKKLMTLILTVLLLCSLTVSSFAWFMLFTNVGFPASTASTEASAYFESGNGTAEEPYVLSNSVHVYNLAWLQYIGYFNGGTANNNLAQSYFVLKNDIDMEDMVIPPIGTAQYPFLGSFDGGIYDENGELTGNYVISNLNTANADVAFVLKPGSAKFETTDSLLSEYYTGSEAALDTETGHIMGFFGVIGDYNEAVSSLEGAGLEGAYSDEENTVKNLALANYTLTSSSSATTVGIVAGYVNAKVENVVVGECSLNMPNANSGSVNSSFTSEYALIGYTADPKSMDENNVILYDPKITTEMLGSGTGGGGGADGGFGGSMDMTSLVRRLTYMFTENVIKGKNYPANFYYPTNPYTYRADYESISTLITYLAKGTVIPLNVNTIEGDANNMFADKEDNKVSGTGGTYKTNDYYSAHNEEVVLSTNTGYIVSSGNADSINPLIRVRTQAIKGSNGGISNSLLSGDTITYTAGSGDEYTTNLKLYTVDKNGTNNEIDHVSNTFKRYSSVVKEFAKNMSGKTMVSGLRFYAGTLRGIEISNAGDVLSGTIKTTALINGATKTEYEMIEGAINFHLSGAGYITAIAGTYASSGTHALFTLYKVERNESNEITKAIQIENIWTKTVGTDITDIVYNVGANEEAEYSESGYVCAFHSENMNKLQTTGRAYYFEIPVEGGDYALGGPKLSSGTYNGAYLMYLDIGSNGGFGLGGSTNPTTVISEYIEESVNTYEYADGVSLAAVDESGKVTDNAPAGNISIQIAGDNKSELTVSRTDDTITVSGGTLTMLGAGLSMAGGETPLPTSSVTTVTQRRRYIHSDGVSAVVTRIDNDDQTITVTVLDGEGNAVEVTEGPTTVNGVTTFKTAQRTYEITWTDITPGDEILAYRYVQTDGTVSVNTPVYNEASKIYEVTIESSSTTEVTVDRVSYSDNVTSAEINGEKATEGDVIVISAAQSP